MRQATLVFVFNAKGQILLAMKKRGFGEGKWNGAGGKVSEGEEIREAAIRELREETGIIAGSEKLEEAGIGRFYFPKKPDWNQEVHIFVLRSYVGSFEETEEMKPEWFDTDDIPYDQMWEDDRYWLPRLVDGERVEFDVHLDLDGHVEEYMEVYGG